MKSLTIVYVTARHQPRFEWFYDSLMAQLQPSERSQIKIVYVGANHSQLESRLTSAYSFDFGSPAVEGYMIATKPSIWQGPHRLTSEDWWAVSNARNTGICLAQSEWIAFVDDRSVLGPQWLQAIKDAMEGDYIVCGSYEKRHHMKVQNGAIVEEGTMVAGDGRAEYCNTNKMPNPFPCPGNWTYGCGIAAPLDWVLRIGGFEEACDGAGFEDVQFGLMAQNQGMPIKFDQRMHLVEDRTPDQLGTPMRREDRGASPHDASHRMLELFGTACNTSNRHLLLQSRQAVLAGKPFPLLFGPREDWWNAAPINENYLKR